jgi:hypothetical protein
MAFRRKPTVQAQVHAAPRPMPTAQQSVSQMIRVAEKFMTEGRYTLAIEQLSLARELDPGNQYIDAIIARARHLQDTDRRKFTTLNTFGMPSGLEGTRYLSVTVGSQFEDGVRQYEDEPATPEEVSVRVRQLTETAQILLNRGLGESAFETLMKAYLLDPISPDVLACEKRVLPVWESLQQQKAAGTPGPASGSLVPEGIGRLETLLRQKEDERLEHERTVWRAAGSPPKSAPHAHHQDTVS